MARLLKGYTDLLQPINLLPDVLAGGGGYPLNGSIGNVSSTVQHISDLVVVAGYNGTFTDVTYSFSNRTLTISGKISSIGTAANHAVFMVEVVEGLLLRDNTVYTIACKAILDNPNNIINVLHSGGIIYANSAKNDGAVRVQTKGNASVIQIGSYNLINNHVGETFTFTITDVVLYEGAYPNPSFCKSIAQLNNEGLMRLAKDDLSNTPSRSWMYDTDCAGMRFTFASGVKTGIRLGNCAQIPAGQTGTYFNTLNVYKNMTRCNLADDGTVNALYGQSGYKEDGSNGQVMVRIPAFYYRVIPLKTKMSSSGRGTAILEGEWWISDSQKEGFKIHPMFVKNGKVQDYAYIGAFEGSTYDVSATSYNLTDAQTVDFTNDKLASVANAHPTSGLTQTGATRAGFRKIASNRGNGWHQMDVFNMSAVQMLMAVEYCSFNSQQCIGRGLVDMSDGTGNNSAKTGSTVGNTTGRASSTKVFVDGSETTQTADGKTSVNYRGIENFWGSMWTFVDGLNYHDVDASGRYCYIAKPDGTSTYADDTASTYVPISFRLPTSSTYQLYLGYDEANDFCLYPTQTGGNENGPVGDYFYQNTGGWRVALLGGRWTSASSAGACYLTVNSASSPRSRDDGGRLAFSPFS